jgi:hypothetical protein
MRRSTVEASRSYRRTQLQYLLNEKAINEHEAETLGANSHFLESAVFSRLVPATYVPAMDTIGGESPQSSATKRPRPSPNEKPAISAKELKAIAKNMRPFEGEKGKLQLRDELLCLNKPHDVRIDLPKQKPRHFPEELTVADWFTNEARERVAREATAAAAAAAIATATVTATATTSAAGELAQPAAPADGAADTVIDTAVGLRDGAVRFCHQLDYATSGVMLLAETKRSAALIGQLFQTRQVEKSYRVLVEGWVSERNATVGGGGGGGDGGGGGPVVVTDTGGSLVFDVDCPIRDAGGFAREAVVPGGLAQWLHGGADGGGGGGGCGGGAAEGQAAEGRAKADEARSRVHLVREGYLQDAAALGCHLHPGPLPSGSRRTAAAAVDSVFAAAEPAAASPASPTSPAEPARAEGSADSAGSVPAGGLKVSYLEVDLFTGRRHQIRVHLAHCLRCPILGDASYGGNSRSWYRMFLHSARLCFPTLGFEYRAPCDFGGLVGDNHIAVRDDALLSDDHGAKMAK